MKVDLSSNYSPTDIAEILATGDDRSDTQLRVSTSGDAYLSNDVGSDNLHGVSLRLETWTAGNGYVGPAASQDKAWVNRLYDALKKHWPDPKDPYIDTY